LFGAVVEANKMECKIFCAFVFENAVMSTNELFNMTEMSLNTICGLGDVFIMFVGK